MRYALLLQLTAGLALLASTSVLTGCRQESVVPNPAVDYYPLVVGTYRTYAVSDTTWSKGAATAINFQFREAITEKFADAAGQTAYRVVRARRASSSAAWVDDSVLVVQPLVQSITRTCNNVRSVELIYPLVAAKKWHKYSFTTLRADSIRAFGPSVGQAFTTPGPTPKTYEATAAVRDRWPESSNDGLYKRRGTLQVFAQGVGAVARRRYYYEAFITLPNQAQQLTLGVIQQGSSRLEVLIDSGKL